MGYIVVFVTCPDKSVAEKIADGLIKEKLAACVNITGEVNSVYFWQGNVEKDQEYLMVIKTTEELFGKLEKFIKENHPYTVPEIIGMPIIKGSKEYLDWIDQTVSREQ
ncbi:divalent-cation tolerance protein CutA [Persephonella sp.]|uniref:divalent-cation tolerance protein CutA n=1 Tax=Persephonella sp. TaxID=2060922 RepID=UPI0025CEA013|nr:divalent-cation tolerance protein CutA [Persephonella sp.]